MKGDFSRVTFDPRKNFTRVLMQQGRVQLDADWNEQAAILLHYLRTLAADVIGPFGGPKGGLGFTIAKVEANGKLADLKIGPGHYYVDGLLCENPGIEKPGVAGRQPIDYSKQRDYPESENLPDKIPFLVYLDVWERHITWVQDDGIREVALGRLDTATRAQLVWQVRAVREASGVGVVGETKDAVMGQWQKWVSFWQPPNRGKLKARAKIEGDDTNPCIASPEARYRGAENQLYRVEIQAYEASPDGTKAVTFKWSRENGSVIFPIRDLRGMTAQLGNLGRDEATGLKRGDWVELVDDVIDLSGKPGPLLRVTEIDAARATVTFEKAAGDNSNLPDYDEQGEATRKHAFLRRWDHKESSYKKKEDTRQPKGGVLFVFGEAGDGWLSLENGVQIQFQKEGTYRPGDYWLIPARTATGDVEWPGTVKEPEAVPPHGVEHHFAPLALVTAGATPIVDLRRSFEGMAK
jgi:hypothetical protein